MMVFRTVPVTTHIDRIYMPGGVTSYLVKGTRCAAMVDSGFGYGDLRGYIQQRIHTPCILLLTHGHLDHAGGAAQFEKAYLNPEDWQLETRHCLLERRIEDLEHGRHGLPAGYTRQDFVASRTDGYLPIKDGDVFDLGGITLRSVAVPGHTSGSVAFLAEEDRALLVGDACNENTLLIFPESTDVETYKHSLEKLWEEEQRFDFVLTNHGSYQADKKILSHMLALCDRVLQGKDAAIKKKFRDFEGWQARPDTHPDELGNLVYLRENRFLHQT